MYNNRIIPLTDIYETDTMYSLALEVPGVSREGLDVTIDNDELQISCKVEDETTDTASEENAKVEYHNYYRNFKLNKEIDRSKVDAELKNGILTVSLFKKEESQPKKIEIAVH